MLIILDLDGTLLDSQKQHLNSFVKALKNSGVYVSKEMIEEIKKRFGRPGYEILREVVPNTNDLIIKTIKKTAVYILMNEEFDNIRLLPFAKTFLENNKDEHEFALASSGYKEFVYKILEKYDLKKYFKAIITSDDVKKAKPDPEILHKALELTNYEKEDAVFIGDTIYDYEAAMNAGIRFIAVLGDSLFAKELSKKSESYNNLEEVEF